MTASQMCFDIAVLNNNFPTDDQLVEFVQTLQKNNDPLAKTALTVMPLILDLRKTNPELLKSFDSFLT